MLKTSRFHVFWLLEGFPCLEHRSASASWVAGIRRFDAVKRACAHVRPHKLSSCSPSINVLSINVVHCVSQQCLSMCSSQIYSPFLFFYYPLLPLCSFFKEGLRVWKSLAPGNSGANPDPSILGGWGRRPGAALGGGGGGGWGRRPGAVLGGGV